MAATTTTTSTNNLSLRSILEKDKLTGSNFLNWERNLRIVLRHERKWYVLERAVPNVPAANARAEASQAYDRHVSDALDVSCLMLATMSPDLQAGLMDVPAFEMIQQLRDSFQEQARIERFDINRAFNSCKMVKGTPVSAHVMKMNGHMDHLARLGHPIPLQMATENILNSLSDDYKPFVVNYNMHNMEKSIAELHSMLKTAELSLGTKSKDVLMIGNSSGGGKKRKGHGGKGKGKTNPNQGVPNGKSVKQKVKKFKPNTARTENRCFKCGEAGHWKRNCPKGASGGGGKASSSGGDGK